MANAAPSDSQPAAPAGVRWPQVAALGSLQIAISLSWIVYALYLPALLLTLGLDARLAATLLLFEGVLAVLLEPAFGFLSDRTFRRIGTRLPFVVAGVFVAAALFTSIPILVLEALPAAEAGRGAFLALVVAWAIAMTVFRTPAISLLSRYSSARQLPVAASLLTFFAAAAAALRPVSRDFLLSLGPIVCFGVSSLVLLASCGAVWYMDQKFAGTDSPRESKGSVLWPVLTLAAAGAGLALAQFALLTQMLPRLFGALPTDWPALGTMVATAIGFLGVCAIGAGPVAIRYGNERVMVAGAGVCAALVTLIAYATPKPSVMVFLVASMLAAFSLVANGVIPLALGRVPSQRGGLALGVYFGGLSATASIATARFRAPISVLESTWLAIIGLALVAAAVWAGRRAPGKA